MEIVDNRNGFGDTTTAKLASNISIDARNVEFQRRYFYYSRFFNLPWQYRAGGYDAMIIELIDHLYKKELEHITTFNKADLQHAIDKFIEFDDYELNNL